MKANELRQLFFDFFKSKNHLIIPSSPMVIRNDPTLMFTNAGMNQFKDIFLGNQQPASSRIANSQKCLRVSGKHNDLEEVGHDTYHHTMFEMLGNWSFGDYFKKEAIEWSLEFLTKKINIPEERLYATIFEGSKEHNVPRDNEAYSHWERCFFNPEGRILEGSWKDNFWEMGETGPCGTCSEIHVDIRDDIEREKIPGHKLVNKGHPQVIEIWNLVFIQYNRKTNGVLEQLPAKHVDTGMGFERLCMVVQGKKSNYDTDVFQSIISKICSVTGKQYGKNESCDIAIRVIADHLRAVSFSISDGQLPSNNKAGYVIRRILRRAIRYGYNNLGMDKPFIYKLVPVLAKTMGDQYPELTSGRSQISKVIHEEETAFLKTLGKGLKMIEKMIDDLRQGNKNIFPGKVAFEFYDTYGFPVDLTQLILKEYNMNLDIEGFDKELNSQKERSRSDASLEVGDWHIILEKEGTEFTGYDKTEDEVRITRFRTVKVKGKSTFQLVFDKTPFYAESGGQVGDTGTLFSGNEKTDIINTIKEHKQIIHIASRLPSDPESVFKASVDGEKRIRTANNHTATHLIHYALRSVLGSYVEQKGSFVNPDYLRFDFSYFRKLGDEEIRQIELMVNRMIRQNIPSEEKITLTLEEAQKMGALALFGEKYGDRVRVIRFGDSIELCGGTHARATGQIGIFKIIRESAIAAGIRRIEAITGEKAEKFLFEQIELAKNIGEMLSAPANPSAALNKLISENKSLKQQVELYEKEKIASLKTSLIKQITEIGDISFISSVIQASKTGYLKDLAFQLRSEVDNLFLVLGAEIDGKANLAVMVSDNLISSKGFNATEIIRELSPAIDGGGGGQPFFAIAGGKNPEGLKKALELARNIVNGKK